MKLFPDCPLDAEALFGLVSAEADLSLEDSLGGQPERVVSVELHKQIISFESSLDVLLSSFLFGLPLLVLLLKLEVEQVLQRLSHLHFIQAILVGREMVAVVHLDVDDEDSVDASGE